MQARFITFEGGEGSGKSTQARRLTSHLQGLGESVLLTREPGGTPEAESLRNMLVSGAADSWSANAEALLMYAARDSHLRKVIRPALASGQSVICDRFMDSTRAYQGYAGSCDPALLKQLEQSVVAATWPDLTLIFDIDPAAGLQRAARRSAGHEARFENKGLAFHQKLREGFLDIAKSEPGRCHIVNASRPEDEVFAAVLAVVERTRG